VLQDYTTFMISKKFDFNTFTMRQKWSVCLSDIVYLKLLCYRKSKKIRTQVANKDIS